MDGPTPSTSRQFTLKWIFCFVAVVGICAALVGVALRPRQNHIPESQLLNSVETVEHGMRFADVETCMHSRPASIWLDQSATGYAVWRFEITDVPYEARRASFFVKFEEGVVESSFLLYPVEAAGGGMVF